MPSSKEPEEPTFQITDRRASSQKPIPPTPTTPTTPTTPAPTLPPTNNPPQNDVLAAFSATPPAVQRAAPSLQAATNTTKLTLPPDITSLFPQGFSLHLLRGTPQVLSSRVDETLAGNWKVHKAIWLPAPGEQGLQFGFDTTLAFDRFANYPCILITFRHEKSGGFVPIGIYNCENHSIQIETNPIRLTPLTYDPVPALKVKSSDSFWSALFPDNIFGGFSCFFMGCLIVPASILFFGGLGFIGLHILSTTKKIQIDWDINAILGILVVVGFAALLIRAWWDFFGEVKAAKKKSKIGARPMSGEEAVKLVVVLLNFLQQQGILRRMAQGQMQQQPQNNQQSGRL